MAAISKLTIKEQLYNELKNRILNQRHLPGEKLIIDSLARELNVSNTPIREALSMLESDGLVVTTPNSGIRVVSLDQNMLRDINQAVYVLLAGGYDLCRQLDLEAPLIAAMQKRLERQMHFWEKANNAKLYRAAIDFDKSFVETTGNKRLITMYDRQAEVFYLAVAYRNRDLRQVEENIKEHQAMLEAVQTGNGPEVKKLLARHYHQEKPAFCGKDS